MHDNESEQEGLSWWEALAEAGPLEMAKRIVPALIGIAAIFRLPGSPMAVAAAVMAFDAPGSEKQIAAYVTALWMASYPLALIACAVAGLLTLRRFTRTRLIVTLAIPVLWWPIW